MTLLPLPMNLMPEIVLSWRDLQVLLHGLECAVHLAEETAHRKGVLACFELEHRRMIDDAGALHQRLSPYLGASGSATRCETSDSFSDSPSA